MSCGNKVNKKTLEKEGVEQLLGLLEDYRKETKYCYFVISINREGLWKVSLPQAGYKLAFENQVLHTALIDTITYIEEHRHQYPQYQWILT